MKNFTFFSSLLLLTLALQSVFAQTNFNIVFQGNSYQDGATIYFHCDNYPDEFEATYEYNSTPGLPADILSSNASGPSGWQFSNNYSNQVLNYTKNSAQDGMFTVTITHNTAPAFSKTMHLYFRISPVFQVTSLPTLGNNQSGTVTVSIYDATYNPYSAWTSVNYSATHNLQVHSSSSYTSYNPGGGASSDSQTLTTSGHGGKISISATNACATSAAVDYYIGTPYLVSTTFNGSPGSSGTVSYVATLALFTDGTATNANWSITNGSGSISPSGTSCNAYPSSFLRVVGAPTNSNGSGEEATFYIWLNGYSPYRAAYPNPTKSTLTLDFDDAQMARELVKEIALYNQNGKAVKVFEAAQAATYFKDTKSVIFDVRDLSSDTYFLHVRMGDKLFENQIVVE